MVRLSRMLQKFTGYNEFDDVANNYNDSVHHRPSSRHTNFSDMVTERHRLAHVPLSIVGQ